MASLLVTGGAGFIGSHFVAHWRARHPRDPIVVLDALTYAGDRANLAGVADVDFVHGDIRDGQLVRRLLADRRLDTLVNFAAETHVDRSIAGPDAFVATNIGGTQALLEAARQAWLDTGSGRPHRFHQISTDEVYGSLAADAPPAREDDAYRPSSPYAASKAACDHLVSAYARTYGLQTTISRCSNNYGPRQFPEKLIPYFIVRALRGQTLPLFGDGSQRRDWLHVADHCRGIERVIERGTAGESYNLAGAGEQSNRAVADTLCRLLDRAFDDNPSLAERFPESPPANGKKTACLVSNVPDRPGHDVRYALDDSKSRINLDYCPSIRFDEGMTQTLNWYLSTDTQWKYCSD